jgi:hypothetical protein
MESGRITLTGLVYRESTKFREFKGRGKKSEALIRME